MYRQHSEETRLLLGRLFHRVQKEGFDMAYTMEDFKRDCMREDFEKLTPEEKREWLSSVPLEDILAGIPL